MTVAPEPAVTPPQRYGSAMSQPVRTNFWPAVGWVAVGIFTMITIEELPIGLLPVMAADLGTTIGAATWTITVPGFVAAVMCLLTPLVIRGLDRGQVLIGALLLMAVAACASAAAPSLGWLIAARVFIGIAIGVFWSLAAPVGMRLVRSEHAARALTLIFAGVSVAVVAGVPLVTWIGTTLGWRQANLVLAGAGALAALALYLALPPTTARYRITPSHLLAAASRRGVQLSLALTALVVTAHYCAYALISQALIERGQIVVTQLGLMLLIFGLAGVVGNFTIGMVLKYSSAAAVMVVAAGLLISLLLLTFGMQGPTSAASVMLMWGLFAGALSVAIQAFVLDAAGTYSEEATALNSAVFNIAIAGGALIGGQLFDAGGLGVVLWVAVAGMALGTALLVLALSPRPLLPAGLVSRLTRSTQSARTPHTPQDPGGSSVSRPRTPGTTPPAG